MFLYAGCMSNFAGWSSSYAVVTKISTIQQATIYPSLFWTTMTLGRLSLNFIPGKDSQKLSLKVD